VGDFETPVKSLLIFSLQATPEFFAVQPCVSPRQLEQEKRKSGRVTPTSD